MIKEIRLHDYDLCNGNNVRNVICDMLEAEAILDLKQAQTNAQQTLCDAALNSKATAQS